MAGGDLVYFLVISIHALREEGDAWKSFARFSRSYFYPRPPRGGRRSRRAAHVRPLEISIHALREEGDLRVRTCVTIYRYFYPRPPRGGRRQLSRVPFALLLFLSTPSARRATNVRDQTDTNLIFLSTPSARRATNFRETATAKTTISIHALREEGDVFPVFIDFSGPLFLSTPSARRATQLPDP